MKRKKPEATAHRKLSFSVNREDIETRSDWASAVIDQCRPSGAAPDPASNPDAVAGDEAATVANHAIQVRDSSGSTVTAPNVESQAPDADVATAAQCATAAVGSVKGLRPLRHLADGLTPGQFTLYTLMYERGLETGEGSRLFRAGYAELGRLSGLSKRGIQNIVDALEQKSAVSVETAPGYRRSETTAYRVYSGSRIVQKWHEHGYWYVLPKGRQLVKVLPA